MALNKWSLGCCCGDTCRVFTNETDPFLNTGLWTVKSGTWVVGGSALRGTDTGSGAQLVHTDETGAGMYIGVTITAEEAGQIAGVIMCADQDLAGPYYNVRITFGDSTVTDDCGTVDLIVRDEFGSDTVLATAPVRGLVDGADAQFVICLDFVLGKFVVSVSSDADFPLALWVHTITAQITDDIAGTLAFTVVGGSSYVQFNAIGPGLDAWQRLFRGGIEDCRVCQVCGTLIDWFLNESSPDDQSTCEFTVSGPYKPVTNVEGYEVIESELPISSLDRDRGYGVAIEAETVTDDTDEMQLEIWFDNDHHKARLVVSAFNLDSTYTCFNDDHAVATLSLLKDDVEIASVDIECIALLGIYDVTMNAGVCGGNVFANVEIGSGGLYTGELEVASTQTGDGNAHSARFTIDEDHVEGGISLFKTVRCLECDQCDNCDTVNKDRSYSVEIEGTPDTYDGTYVLEFDETFDYDDDEDNDPVEHRCRYFYEDEDITVSLVVYRSRFYLVITTSDGSAEGKLIGSTEDCDSFVDFEFSLSGAISGTATANSV